MTSKKGSLSINSENIFPIIKKWLYQDHDIFYRELISNGCDAVTKLKKLSLIGEYTAPEGEKYRIDVTVDPRVNTITFEDNGIGMTADEVDSYINQIAFSGAADFLQKYKDKANEDQIIGHFGLGFYSAFMVADRVEIDTLSYKEGAEPVRWISEDGMSFEMTEGTRTTHGTSVTLTINEEELQFCNEYKAREVMDKYCSFMPVEIYLKDAAKEEEKARKKAEEDAKKKTESTGTIEVEGGEKPVAEDQIKDYKEVEAEVIEKPLNDTHPLWNESPSQVKEEQYKEFYRKVFRDFKEPLFWIHLNMDYPFNLKGILYFPKINNEYENLEGTIKLYNNQVFIADNIKEVIPEYLLLLKGVIDCPDLPLNVSRSALQNDGFVKKISDYITKKVSDKLTGMFKVDRENYEKYWDDISPFIKYGCLKDEKFGDKMKDAVIFKDLDGKYVTVDEYLKKDGDGAEEIKEEAEGGTAPAEPSKDEKETDRKKETIFYVTDEKEQGQYIRMFKNAGQNAVMMLYAIDTPFISWFEQKKDDLSFVRIDADLTESFKEETAENSNAEVRDKLVSLFRAVLNDEELDVKVESLKDASVASLMTMSEDGRRMQEMMKMYAAYGMGMGDMGKDAQTLVLNSNNELVKRLLTETDVKEPSELGRKITEQLYDMALLQRNGLSQERMAAFIARSQELMLKL
ncbi:MAG: molecular chaperone HtpG [Lachnospiraceae bacterium]|nr:molecular chaperone HtpG [Lachnospiraceae bacterium]